MIRVIFTLVVALLFNTMSGAAIGSIAGFSPVAGAIGMNAVSFLLGSFLPKNVLRAGVLTEVWTGELVKALRGRLEGSWLDGIPDSSSLVNNDVIHLVEVGVDPEVLVNNTTYPIAAQSLSDSDINISLDKFQTKVTPVTDDELYALSYDKIARVKEAHANAIHDAKFKKAAHALCASSNSATTPVLATTGEWDAASGRIKLIPKDLVAAKAALDKLGVPAENRRLVLCTDHVNDLLEIDRSFKEQYNINAVEGKIGRLYGFDIYEYANNPFYTANGNKKGFGVAPTAGEFQCSFAFYTPRVFKATGSTKMYYSTAETDPEYQRNKVAFTHRFVCMFKKADAGVVVRSAYSATDPNAVVAPSNPA